MDNYNGLHYWSEALLHAMAESGLSGDTEAMAFFREWESVCYDVMGAMDLSGD